MSRPGKRPMNLPAVKPTALAAGLLLALPLALGAGSAAAQSFDSTSDGSDGALNLTAPGTLVLFSPEDFDPPLDADGDGRLEFTEINIASGVTLDMRGATRGGIVILSQGNVVIDGTLLLNGENGHDSTGPASRARPGPGGFSGGLGARTDTGVFAEGGFGPGGAKSHTITNGIGGGGAGHRQNGSGSNSGSLYGNPFLLPLTGGSGGGGGGPGGPTNISIFCGSSAGVAGGGGGGAGGGALLIASSTAVTVNGVIDASGGDGGENVASSGCGGGGGSGGGVRIIAPIVAGNGSIDVSGGAGGDNGGTGSSGYTRLEAFQNAFVGQIFGDGGTFSVPGPITLAVAPIRVVRVNGQEVAAQPSGSLVNPDVIVNQPGPSTFEIEATGVPPGTVVTLTLVSDTLPAVTVESTPLAGTLELSTATATAVVAPGVSQFFLEADFTPGG